MTQEEKQLLLIDLSARLPYGVKLRYVEDLVVKKESHIITLNNIYLEHILNGDADIKPYLRPMSSMTDEEKEHLQLLHNIISDKNYGDGYAPAAWEAISEFNVYCYEHHLDNRGLIEIGLALEAPEHMYD